MTPDNKIRVLIADDHAFMRDGISNFLATTPDIEVVGAVASGEEALEFVRNHGPDLVIMDISMPGIWGMELFLELKKIKPLMPVVILSMLAEAQYAIEFFRAGASAFFNKADDPNELPEVIRKAFDGETYITPHLAQKVTMDVIHSRQPPHQSLSTREFEVMCKLGSGKTVSEIAKELGLSAKTVSTHRTNLLAKMNMKTNAQLTSYCIKYFLTDHKL